MERNYKLMWIQEFKIALIEQDIQKLATLIDADLQFDSIEEIEEAMYMIKEARKLLSKLKNETAISMQQLKKNRDFLNATQPPVVNKFDITS